jgi:hypothetical protein
MKATIFTLCVLILSAQCSYAQERKANPLPAEQEIIRLSRSKWQWMAEKNVDSLNVLFDEKAMFIHMGGSWENSRS